MKRTCLLAVLVLALASCSPARGQRPEPTATFAANGWDSGDDAGCSEQPDRYRGGVHRYQILPRFRRR